MEAREPVRPGWPCVRVTSAGLGFARQTPIAFGSAVTPAQTTVVLDETKRIARPVSA